MKRASLMPESSSGSVSSQSDIRRKMNLDQHIRKVVDFPKKGILYYDITSLLHDPIVFGYIIRSALDAYRDMVVESIVAIESRGFIFAAPMAYELGVPLVLARKRGKLPGTTIAKKYSMEYNQAEIEIHQSDIVKRNTIIVDDLIATGETVRAVRDILTENGANVFSIFGVIGLKFLNYREVLSPTHIVTLIDYES